jgi:hypothetical protein
LVLNCICNKLRVISTNFAAYRSIALIVTRPFVKTRVCQGFFLHSI